MKYKLTKKVFGLGIKALFAIAILACLSSCGSSSGGTTPVSIPAPTGGYITASAPNPDSKSLVFGYIYANDTALPNVTVAITNSNNSATASATTDSSAYFATLITASLGDTLKVKYLDPTYNLYSDETSITVGTEAFPMSNENLIPYDIDLGTSGRAYVVGNDGTDSEIIELDLANNTVLNRALFTNVTFDKVSAHSTIDYIAVLDTAGGKLYWFDTETLSDDVTPASEINVTTPTDLAIADYSAGSSINDVVVVSVISTTASIQFYSIDPTEKTLSSTGSFCFANPSEVAGTTISVCSGGFAIQPTRTDTVSIRVTSTNAARVAIVNEYDDGSIAYHWGFLTSTSPPTITIATDASSLSRSYSIAFAGGVDPNQLDWYNDTSTLVSDTTNNNLELYEEECGASCSISNFELSGSGTTQQMVGITTDADNNRAFVSDSAGNLIAGVDLSGTNFVLSGTNYTARVGPTQLVYYDDGSNGYMGVVFPDSRVMRVISASP